MKTALAGGTDGFATVAQPSGKPTVTGIMEVLKKIRGAIFDLDGTLLDSTWLWLEIDRRFLARRGLEVPPDYKQAIEHMELRHAAEYTVRRFGLREEPDGLVQEWTAMAKQAYANEICIKPHAAEFLQALADRGIQLGIATSSREELFMPALRSNGISSFFSAIATTREVGKSKDSPAVYCLAAERLGCRPQECAVFEDILVGIRSAGSAGFLTVGVYDSAAAEQWENIQREASYCLYRFDGAIKPKRQI